MWIQFLGMIAQHKQLVLWWHKRKLEFLVWNSYAGCSLFPKQKQQRTCQRSGGIWITWALETTLRSVSYLLLFPVSDGWMSAILSGTALPLSSVLANTSNCTIAFLGLGFVSHAWNIEESTSPLRKACLHISLCRHPCCLDQSTYADNSSNPQKFGQCADMRSIDHIRCGQDDAEHKMLGLQWWLAGLMPQGANVGGHSWG